MNFAITKEGSAAVLCKLISNLKGIEANPTAKALQAEFLARRDALWERLTPADRVVVAQEHDRVRQLVKPRKRRKQSDPAAA